MSIWHFQPQEWQTLSTSKEKELLVKSTQLPLFPCPAGCGSSHRRSACRAWGPSPLPELPPQMPFGCGLGLGSGWGAETQRDPGAGK